MSGALEIMAQSADALANEHRTDLAHQLRDVRSAVADLIATDIEFNEAMNAFDIPRSIIAKDRRNSALARIVGAA